MDAHEARIDVDALLAQRDGVLRLARHLVGDDRAEDVAQEAMLIGLGSVPPRRGLSAWLAGVTRNLARHEHRSTARRRTREQRHAQAEALPSTDALVVRAAEHRRLLGALETLDEPFRTALLLRYFEGTPPREIAKRLGVPVATVKSRLHRGLARLRVDLDAAHGGDRRAWVGVLAPAALTGGVAVGTKLVLSVAALAVLALGAWMFFDNRSGAVTPPTSTGDPSAEFELDEERAGLTARGIEPAAVAEDDAETQTTDTRGVVIRGRVVDSARVPVPGATVRLLRDGREVGTAASNAEGQFDLDSIVEVPDGSTVVRMVVQARTQDGRAGYGHVYWSRSSRDEAQVAPIVIRPSSATDVSVRGDGQPLDGAEVLARIRPDPGTAWFVAHRLVTNREGRARLEGLPAGSVGLLVMAGGRASAIDGFEAPREVEGPVIVTLGPPRSFVARVREDQTDEPVEGATVQVSALVSGKGSGAGWRLEDIGFHYVTDATGEVRIPAFSEGTTIHVSAASDMHPRSQWGGHPWVEVMDATVDLTVPTRTVLRWPLASGPQPANGTRVRTYDARTSTDSGGFMVPAHAVIEDGHLVMRNALAGPWVPFEALAVLDDGRMALLSMAKAESLGPEISFGPGRAIHVRVVDANGQPIDGIHASVRGQPQEMRSHLVGRTGSDGRCVIRPLLPLPTEVYVYGLPETYGDVTTSVDLESGDGRAEIVLPRPTRITLTLKVDGEPGLPSVYEVWIGDAPRTGKQVRDLAIDEDPASGQITFELHAARSLEGERVWIRAPGYPHSGGELAASEAGALSAEIALDAQGLIDVRVFKPTDGALQLGLDRFAPEYGRWYGHTLREGAKRVSDDTWRMGPLSRGRYRAVDRLTGIVSQPVDIDPTRGPKRVDLALSRAGNVTGRIAVPDGVDMTFVRVLVRGRGETAPVPPPTGMTEIREPPGALRPETDGTFSVRVPGDRTVTLIPWHPVLRAGGSVPVDGPDTNVALRLERGPTARFAFDTGASSYSPFIARTVKLFKGEAKGEPIFVGHPISVAGKLEFGGFEPGTYTVWIDGVTLAPSIKKGVVLRDGLTEIEGVTFGAGSSVRVAFLLPDDQTKPMVRLRAEKVGTPDMIRSTFVMQATKEGVLEGLSAGRWSFMVRNLSGAEIVHQEEFEVDGKSDVDVTVDLR